LFVLDFNIPGLATEAPTGEPLRVKIPGMVRDLIETDPTVILVPAGLRRLF